MKSNSYTPGAGSDGNTLSIGASIAAKANQTKTSGPNPWAPKE
ncbi:hypothetical protein [Clostridium sp.]|nr:hypothetical protein [Clostridium sp.]MDU7365413.1 hypothetical protein [Clostridium sp.]